MPLITFVPITPKARWRTLLSSLIGAKANQVEIGIGDMRNAIKTIAFFLKGQDHEETLKVDALLAKLQAAGARTVVLSLYPVGAEPLTISQIQKVV